MWKCPKCGCGFENTNQDHYCIPITTINEYIKAQPEDVRLILIKVRETIHAAAPDAVEKISWRMPTFYQVTVAPRGENLIHFAAFKRHIGIYPGGEAVGVFADKLSSCKTSKGAIQFPLNKPIPYDLIAEITKFRVKAVDDKIDRTSERQR